MRSRAEARRFDLHVLSADNTIYRMRQLSMDAPVRKVKEKLLRSLQELEPGHGWNLEEMILVGPQGFPVPDSVTVESAGLTGDDDARVYTAQQYRLLRAGSADSPAPPPAAPSPAAPAGAGAAAPPPPAQPVTLSVAASTEVQQGCGTAEFRLTGLAAQRVSWGRVKQLLAPHCRLPPEQQVIVYEGERQTDEQTLAAAGVHSDAFCELHRVGSSAPPVAAADEDISLVVHSEVDGVDYRLPGLGRGTTLGHLRTLLARATGIAADRQQLLRGVSPVTAGPAVTLAQLLRSGGHDAPAVLTLRERCSPAASRPQPAAERVAPAPAAAEGAPVPSAAGARQPTAVSPKAAAPPPEAETSLLVPAAGPYTPSAQFPLPAPPRPDAAELRSRDYELRFRELAARAASPPPLHCAAGGDRHLLASGPGAQSPLQAAALGELAQLRSEYAALTRAIAPLQDPSQRTSPPRAPPYPGEVPGGAPTDEDTLRAAQRELELERELFAETLSKQRREAEAAHAEALRAQLQGLERTVGEVHTAVAELKHQAGSVASEHLEALRMERERLEEARAALEWAQRGPNHAEKLRVTVFPAAGSARRATSTPADPAPAASPASQAPLRSTSPLRPLRPSVVVLPAVAGLDPPVWHAGRGPAPPRRQVGTPAPLPPPPPPPPPPLPPALPPPAAELAAGPPLSEGGATLSPCRAAISSRSPSGDAAAGHAAARSSPRHSPQRRLALDAPSDASRRTSPRAATGARGAPELPAPLRPQPATRWVDPQEAELERRTELRMLAARREDLLRRQRGGVSGALLPQAQRRLSAGMEYDEDSTLESDDGVRLSEVRCAPCRAASSASAAVSLSASGSRRGPSADSGYRSAAAAVRGPYARHL